MPIRPVRSPAPEPDRTVVARARTRPPASEATVPDNAVLVTHAITLTVTDPHKLWEATKAVARARGQDETMLRARVAKSGSVDVGDCVRLLLEEAVTALATISGAEVGDAETYLELYEPVQPVATSSA